MWWEVGHFWKSTCISRSKQVKINPDDFAGMEAWSFLASRMQVGINRAMGVGSESRPTFRECVLGGLQQVWESGHGGGKVRALGPENRFLPGGPRLFSPVGSLLYRASSHPNPWSCILALTHGRGLVNF